MIGLVAIRPQFALALRLGYTGRVVTDQALCVCLGPDLRCSVI